MHMKHALVYDKIVSSLGLKVWTGGQKPGAFRNTPPIIKMVRSLARDN